MCKALPGTVSAYEHEAEPICRDHHHCSVFAIKKKHLISFWHDLTMKHGEPRTTWICQPDTLGNSPMSSSTCHVVSSKKRQNNAWRCWFQIGCTCTVHLIVTINIYIYIWYWFICSSAIYHCDHSLKLPAIKKKNNRTIREIPSSCAHKWMIIDVY